MFPGFAYLFILSAACVAHVRAAPEEDLGRIVRCVNETGITEALEGEILHWMMDRDAQMPEPAKEGKCFIFCLAREYNQIDDKGNWLHGTKDHHTPEEVVEIEKCENEGHQIECPCEKVYQMAICTKKSDVLYHKAPKRPQ